MRNFFQRKDSIFGGKLKQNKITTSTPWPPRPQVYTEVLLELTTLRVVTLSSGLTKRVVFHKRGLSRHVSLLKVLFFLCIKIRIHPLISLGGVSNCHWRLVINLYKVISCLKRNHKSYTKLYKIIRCTYSRKSHKFSWDTVVFLL